MRMQKSDKTGGIIFFGLNVCIKQTQNNTAERYKEKKEKKSEARLGHVPVKIFSLSVRCTSAEPRRGLPESLLPFSE